MKVFLCRAVIDQVIRHMNNHGWLHVFNNSDNVMSFSFNSFKSSTCLIFFQIDLRAKKL